MEGRRKTDEEVAAPGKKKKKKDGSSFVEPTDVAGSSISLPLVLVLLSRSLYLSSESDIKGSRRARGRSGVRRRPL